MPPSLAELRARPDDLELLLVYADWLDSEGDPRGELIAVQEVERLCEDAVSFERARARALALIESQPTLCPELEPRVATSGEARKLWAIWRGGFIRQLELLIDQPAPRPGAGWQGWSELLVDALAHPSLALVEELLIRVDLRGEPLDETEIAVSIILRAFEVLHDPAALRLALWTHRVPPARLRERLNAGLGKVRVAWSSTDITLIPPPPNSPIHALEQALSSIRDDARAGDHRYDLVWLDARGHFRDLFDVRADELGPFAGTDSNLRVLVRHMAERRRAPMLASFDRLPQRRIAYFFDQLAARFDRRASRHALAPRGLPERRPERIGIDEACGRLGVGRPLASILAAMTATEWWWVEDRCDERAWAGSFGLGPEQLLAFARLES